ncbi:MAG: amidohydrolase family protein [bacterium]|nr:amidohydrolase family protein [bacterium]
MLIAIAVLVPTPVAAEEYDLVISGGRVMDPESGLDAVRYVGVRDGKIAALSEAPLDGSEVLDASGLVVAPGFIDLHVHGQHGPGYDFMSRDGVTTALDLEAGVNGSEDFLTDREGQARIHYGASAGHIGSRVEVKHGASSGHALTRRLERGFAAWLLRIAQRWVRPTKWMREAADAEEREEIVASLEQELDAGAIGIGIGLAYTPGVDAEEMRAVFALAAKRGVPCFVHIRDQQRVGDLAPIDEVIGYARDTGASLHVVHINSSSRASIDVYLARIARARAQGLDVTTEAYPYTAGSTMIESALFDEGFRERRGIDYGDLQWQETGERLTKESFEKYRKRGGTVIIHMMQPEWIERAISHRLVMVASDGMPMVAGAHPRGAGSHARVLRVYVRERGVISLMNAIEKFALMPARRLEAFVPAMAHKGRIGVGSDADLALFDPEAVTDLATYEQPLQYSRGIEHVLVAGTFVVRDGELVPGATPGRGLRALPRGDSEQAP